MSRPCCPRHADPQPYPHATALATLLRGRGVPVPCLGCLASDATPLAGLPTTTAQVGEVSRLARRALRHVADAVLTSGLDVPLAEAATVAAAAADAAVCARLAATLLPAPPPGGSWTEPWTGWLTWSPDSGPLTDLAAELHNMASAAGWVCPDDTAALLADLYDTARALAATCTRAARAGWTPDRSEAAWDRLEATSLSGATVEAL